MPRTTVRQLKQSRFPEALGICASDTTRICAAVNEVTQRLINAGGENGWWGGWARVVFEVRRDDPYITLPTQFARMINADICRVPINVQNEWFEFLEDGIGLQKPCENEGRGCLTRREGYDRNTVPTAYDLTPTNQYIRCYYTDPRDVGKTVTFINALDSNGNNIYSTVDDVQVNGFVMTLAVPMVTTNFVVTSFSGVQKEETYGDVLVYQVDATSGDESLLARYKPNDINPAYRRYLLKGLPCNCCDNAAVETRTAQVTTMCKYEYFPVQNDTDFLLVGNIPALIEEGQAIRFEGMDSTSADQKAILKHQKAIQLLQQELWHYLGRMMPAINYAPFGSAFPARAGIGTLV